LKIVYASIFAGSSKVIFTNKKSSTSINQ